MSRLVCWLFGHRAVMAWQARRYGEFCERCKRYTGG